MDTGTYVRTNRGTRARGVIVFRGVLLRTVLVTQGPRLWLGKGREFRLLDLDEITALDRLAAL